MPLGNCQVHAEIYHRPATVSRAVFGHHRARRCKRIAGVSAR